MENIVRGKQSGVNCQSQNKHKPFLSSRNFMHYAFYSLSVPERVWFCLPLRAGLWGSVVLSVLWLWRDGGSGARSWPTQNFTLMNYTWKLSAIQRTSSHFFLLPSYYVNLFPECLTRLSSGRSGTASEVKHHSRPPLQKLVRLASSSFLPDNEACDYHLDRL